MTFTACELIESFMTPLQVHILALAWWGRAGRWRLDGPQQDHGEEHANLQVHTSSPISSLHIIKAFLYCPLSQRCHESRWVRF